MNETMVYNTTTNGLMNLSMQTGTVGTIFGSTIILGLLISVLMGSHSWNTKGWLYKLVKYIIQTFGENVLYGVATTTFCGSIYYIGSELSKFGEANPRFLSDVVLFIGEAAIVLIVLAFVGFLTKPLYEIAWEYATGKDNNKRALAPNRK